MSFLQRLAELHQKEPMICLPIDSSCENSDYNTYIYRCKSCYMCAASSRMENCYYLEASDRCKDSAEGYGNAECELCYECLDCKSCYNCDWSQDCLNCSDLKFCFSCTGCRNCFGCVSLRNKEYHVFNQPFTKEAYEKMMAEFDPANPEHLENFRRKFEELKKNTPVAHMRGVGNENVTGDYINNSKNIAHSFYVDKSEDILYCNDEIYGDKDCCDVDHLHNSELCWNSMSVDTSYNIHNSFWIVNSSDLDYCWYAQGCKNCFGCVNIKSKQYCILNEQYEPEEYFKKMEEIKQQMIEEGEYGKFFPSTYPLKDTIVS